MKVDVVLGLQMGDEGKGKICNSLLKKGSYTHVIKFNGGNNCGATIYHNGKKFVTHIIPAGVFHGIKSIIGPGCVVNVESFLKEIEDLNKNGVKTEGLVFIAKNAHIITYKHLHEDGLDSKIGTTKTGNGQAYKDKYLREGIRAESIKLLEPYLIDMYDEFYVKINRNYKILAQGAQAFGLDIDWGDYPFVTSSHCGVGSVLLNGFNHKHLGDIYGVIKAYSTYVGAKKFQPDDLIFEKIQELGNEFGATTGRKRQCNWLDWDLVKQAIQMNGVNKLIVNKGDILNLLGEWKIIYREQTLNFPTQENFENWIEKQAAKLGAKVYFSYNPNDCSFDNPIVNGVISLPANDYRNIGHFIG